MDKLSWKGCRKTQQPQRQRDTKSDVERREEGAGEKNLCTVSLFRRSCGSWESNSLSLTDSGKFFSSSFGEELLF